MCRGRSASGKSTTSSGKSGMRFGFIAEGWYQNNRIRAERRDTEKTSARISPARRARLAFPVARERRRIARRVRRLREEVCGPLWCDFALQEASRIDSKRPHIPDEKR